MAEEFETIELEYSEDEILYYIVDEDDNEIGFALEEDGQEVEYYYEGFDGGDYELVEVVEPPAEQAAKEAPAPKEPLEARKAEDVGYLQKIAAIAGHSGNKARKRAEEGLGVVRGKAEEGFGTVRDKAEVGIDKVRTKAEIGVDKATEAVESGGKKLKDKTSDMDLGITREGVAETTADLNAIAKEGAETARELKEAYDDIMDSFGFLVPKGIRRKLP